MHRCLSIVEVQRAIFHEIYQQCEPKDHATLARLARTCRAFNGSALDVLWAALESFALLVQCLPRDLWKIDLVDRKLSFLRPMSLRDWEIFFKYSIRVRVVFQSAGPGRITRCSSLADDVIFALSHPPTYGPLIPCLKVLYWDQPNKKHAPLLRSLLTPSLVTLSLSTLGCALRSPEVSILSSIGTVCPSLRSLCISSHTAFSHFLDGKGEKILSEAILYLHALESLVCPALDEVALIHLSRLPFLNELWMELRPDFKLEKVTSLGPPAFGSINSLTLNASSLATLTSILESMQVRPSQVSFTVMTAPTVDAIRLFFLVLANSCGSERLSWVSLSVERRQTAPPQQVTLSTFQSLLALPSIRYFELDVPCAICLDDADITTLAKHWPILTRLSINAERGWGTLPPRITHQGLLTLLSNCPELMNFSLAVDFSGIDVHAADLPGSRPGNGVTHENCLIAGFVTSTIEYPVAIAAFLSDICPRLASVKASWNENTLMSVEDPDDVELYRERWEEVDGLVPAFAAVRRQCLEWNQKQKMDEDVASA
ncbi:hypothetical protein BS17DRAFT_559394 [Gyrodon lividus]|nr:hypothetical protein BS17DRAFT_559394 [Gyrodon lividus]